MLASFDPAVYVILDPEHCAGRSVLEVARAVLDGGATMLQLRAKTWNDRQVLDCARALVELATPYHVPVLINDRADIALAAGAAGVHVGPNDLPVRVVRELLGPRALIGASARSPEAAVAEQEAGADYLGIGALYDASGAKPDASAPRGPAWIGAVREAGVTLPIVGIGGIEVDSALDVVRHGADGVAVIRAACSAPSPAEVVSALRRAVDRGRAARY